MNRKLMSLMLAAFMMVGVIHGQVLTAYAETVESVSEDRATTPLAPSLKGLKVCFVVSNMFVDFFRQMTYGCIQACEDYGMELTILTGYQSINEQLTMMEDEVNRGVDVFVAFPADNNAMDPIIELCRDNGVIFVSTSVINSEKYPADLVVQADNYSMGMELAGMLGEDLDHKGNIAVLAGPSTNVVMIDKIRALHDYCDQYPDLNIIGEINHENDQASATTAMQDLITMAADEHIDAVFALSEVYAIGAIVPLEEAGYEVGEDVGIYSVNFSNDMVDYMRAGKIRTGVYTYGMLEGYWSAEMGARMKIGDAVPNMIQMPVKNVTFDEIDKYEEICKAPREFDFNAWMASH